MNFVELLKIIMYNKNHLQPEFIFETCCLKVDGTTQKDDSEDVTKAGFINTNPARPPARQQSAEWSHLSCSCLLRDNFSSTFYNVAWINNRTCFWVVASLNNHSTLLTSHYIFRKIRNGEHKAYNITRISAHDVRIADLVHKAIYFIFKGRL